MTTTFNKPTGKLNADGLRLLASQVFFCGSGQKWCAVNGDERTPISEPELEYESAGFHPDIMGSRAASWHGIPVWVGTDYIGHANRIFERNM